MAAAALQLQQSTCSLALLIYHHDFSLPLKPEFRSSMVAVGGLTSFRGLNSLFDAWKNRVCTPSWIPAAAGGGVIYLRAMIVHGGCNVARRCRQGPHWPTSNSLLLNRGVPAGVRFPGGSKVVSPVHQPLVIRQSFGAYFTTSGGRQNASSRTSPARCSLPSSWAARALAALATASGAAQAAVSQDATASVPFLTNSAATHTADCLTGDNSSAVHSAGQKGAILFCCAPLFGDQPALNSLPAPVGHRLDVLASDDNGESSAWKQTQPTEKLVQQASALPSLMNQTLPRTKAILACEKAAHPVSHRMSGESRSSGATCCTDTGGETRKVPEATNTPRKGKQGEAATAAETKRERRRREPCRKREVNFHEFLQQTVEAAGAARILAAPKNARKSKGESGGRQHETAARAVSLDSALGSATKPNSRRSSTAAASGADGAMVAFASGTTGTAPLASLPVVPACSGCSLNSAAAWKKWLQLLSETDAQLRQQLLLQDFPTCKRHYKKQASGPGHAVVGFQRLLQLLDAAALHPHATADAVAVLRRRVRLGVTSPALVASDTPTAVQVATNLPTTAAPEPSVEEGECSASVTSEAAARLSYVEHGLSTLALEKGAQLLQSLRDFDCMDSFLVESTAACAAPRVGFAPPRWSFRVLEGPLNVQAHRQKIKMERMETGSLLILKPVDQKSEALTRELRRLHGKSFDFSFVSAHGHIGSVAGVPEGTGGAAHVNRDGTDVQQLLQQQTGNLQRVRCAMCGKWLFFLYEELLQPHLRCPDCGGAATEVFSTASVQPPSGSAALDANSQLLKVSKSLDTHGPSQDRWSRGNEGDTLGDLHHVLQELEAAAAWTGCRFALPAPAFIASVCSQGSRKTLKVRVFPLWSGPASSSSESSRGSQLDNAATADVQSQGQQQERQHERSVGDLDFTTGSQFWAMPVSFVEALYSRQVEALARLANVSLPARRPRTPANASSKEAYPLTPLPDNHILRVLTANPETRKRLLADDKRPDGEDSAAVNVTGVIVEKHDFHARTEVSSKVECDGSTLAVHTSFTPRQYEAVSAATSRESRIVSIEGKLREWLSKCMYTSVEPCLDPRCPCKSPIFVAAGTHAALRSLKNKLDQEGARAVRQLSILRAASLWALACHIWTQLDAQALVFLDTVYQGHRLATLGLRPRRILVDESSQLTEFAGLLALIHGADVAVLIGDEKQLPPASVLPPSRAPRSLFSALKGDACRSILLNHQFRMPPLLAAFISAHFYEGKLLTHPYKAALSQLPHLPPPQKQQSVFSPIDASSSPLGVDSGKCPAPFNETMAGRSDHNADGAVHEAGPPNSWKRSTFVVETTSPSKLALISNSSSSTPNFPWPDSSEGDRDLALRLLQQLQKARGPMDDFAGTGGASHVTHQILPQRLPVLFIDTSLWASGHSRKLARLVTPSAAPGKLATTGGDVRADSDVLVNRGVEEGSALLRSLPAEQRVKGSLQNSLEAFLVYGCVKALLRDGISQKDIAVLTPYQAQAQLLSRVLHPAEMMDKAQGQLHTPGRLSFVQPVLDVLDEGCRPHPQVFTVDSFQGHERQYVILSAVKCSRRSRKEFFLFDPRRINVALSRASRGLIIVGSAQALTDASPTWRSFLLFLRALGAALPLDHPSLRGALTVDLLLPRPTEAHRLTPGATSE
ncbi:hypothetical protein Esti_000142 [Eimeria stiedai]